MLGLLRDGRTTLLAEGKLVDCVTNRAFYASTRVSALGAEGILTAQHGSAERAHILFDISVTRLAKVLPRRNQSPAKRASAWSGSSVWLLSCSVLHRHFRALIIRSKSLSLQKIILHTGFCVWSGMCFFQISTGIKVISPNRFVIHHYVSLFQLHHQSHPEQRHKRPFHG